MKNFNKPVKAYPVTRWERTPADLSMPELIDDLDLKNLPVMPLYAFAMRTVKIFSYALWLQVRYMGGVAVET